MELVNIDKYLSSQSVLHGSVITAGLGEPWHRWSDTTTRSDSRLHKIFLLRSPDAHNIQHKTYTSSNTCLWSRKKNVPLCIFQISKKYWTGWPDSIMRLVQVYQILNWSFWQTFQKNICCFSHTHLGTKDCNPAMGRTHPRKTAEVCPLWECCKNTWHQGCRGFQRIAPSW